MEVVTPAATVVSTEHYQAALQLTRQDNRFFSGDFPKPGAGRQLHITRMTCMLFGSSDTTPDVGEIELRKADGTRVLSQYLPIDQSTSGGNHAFNRAIDMLVRSNQRIHVRLSVRTGFLGDALCTATGTRETLG